jgi:hypothetical protein
VGQGPSRAEIQKAFFIVAWQSSGPVGLQNRALSGLWGGAGGAEIQCGTGRSVV